MLEDFSYDNQIQFYPWIRAYKTALNNKNTLILSVSRTAERENLFEWIGELNREYFAFFKVKGNQNIRKIHKLDDLANYRVVVTQGSVMDSYISQKDFKYVERASDIEEAFRLLFLGRVDLVLKFRSIPEPELRFMSYSLNDLEPVFIPQDSAIKLYLAIHPESDHKLVEQLKTSFDRLTNTGALEQLKSKWKLDK